jgi:hypothetical protein
LVNEGNPAINGNKDLIASVWQGLPIQVSQKGIETIAFGLRYCSKSDSW